MRGISVIRKGVFIALLVTSNFCVSVLTHEFGHALGSKMAGHRVAFIHVWPGYQIVPEFGKPVEYEWPNGVIAVTHAKKVMWHQRSILDISDWLSDKWNTSLPLLLSSGTNWFISIVFIAILLALKPKGFWLSLTVALFYYDVFSYVVFPYFFNLPHLIFWGGHYVEPAVALTGLGLHSDVAAMAIVSVCIIQTVIVAITIKKD
ncbi:MAG: hypothetical protein HWE26_13035 [Alteromonadaceae bacterium]|nr:hypothetical protein [Alteromonadaceae bacterium]